MTTRSLAALLLALAGASGAQAQEVRILGDHESRHLVYQGTQPAIVGSALARITGDGDSHALTTDRVLQRQRSGPVAWVEGGGTETQLIYGPSPVVAMPRG